MYSHLFDIGFTVLSEERERCNLSVGEIIKGLKEKVTDLKNNLTEAEKEILGFLNTPERSLSEIEALSGEEMFEIMTDLLEQLAFYSVRQVWTGGNVKS